MSLFLVSHYYGEVSLVSEEQGYKEKAYQKLVTQTKPKPPIVRNVVAAFTVGGIICTIGQAILNIYLGFGLTIAGAATATSATLVFVAAILTGLGVYDEIGRFGGAGSIVPITGFANSMVAPAMEFKREGLVLGVGAKLFSIAGPVLVWGITTAWIIGLLAYFIM